MAIVNENYDKTLLVNPEIGLVHELPVFDKIIECNGKLLTFHDSALYEWNLYWDFHNLLSNKTS